MGGEVIQFGRAELLGGGEWRLSALLRGRLGSEDAIGTVAAGVRFTLIDDPALVPIPSNALAPLAVGGSIELIGVADNDPVVVAVEQVGRAQRPLSPVHGAARWRDDGGLALSWIRRSRGGFAWPDGRDVPLDERDERYRLVLSAGVLSDVMLLTAPLAALSAADVARWRGAGAMLTLSVVQLGDAGESSVLAWTAALP